MSGAISLLQNQVLVAKAAKFLQTLKLLVLTRNLAALWLQRLQLYLYQLLLPLLKLP